MPFHLVTTSDPNLRSKSKKNLFLGSWCVSYKEQISKEGKNYDYVTPKSIDKKTLDEDHDKSIYYFNKIFKEVVYILNNHHDEKFSERQWMIMIGKYIYEFICLVINRYDNLERAIKNNEIESSSFYNIDHYDLSCNDCANFHEICDKNLWNNAIYFKLLNYLDNNLKKFSLKHENKKYNKKRKNNFVKNIIKKNYTLIFKNKILNSKSFISNTYLSKKDEFKLLYLFRQLPIFLEYDVDFNSTNFSLRDDLGKILLKNNEKNLENAIRGVFFQVFPNIYLESFARLKNTLNKSILPKNPKLIFNSNDYFENELFKIYSANKINNSKYIIGQHGCNYGPARYQHDQIFIFKTVDKFITWGWSENEKTKKGFLFPKLTPNKKKGDKITYMIRFITHNWKTHDIHYELEKEFKNDFDLVKSFNREIKKKLQIKMHPGDGRFFDFQTKLRWSEAIPDIKILNPKINFDKFKNGSKLFIFNYESTGFLQLININFPTLLILRDFEIQKKDNYKKYYEYLLNSKILHLTNESLVNHLNNINDDIEMWWNSYNTQNNLKKFINLFANNKNNTPKNLKKILLED